MRLTGIRRLMPGVSVQSFPNMVSQALAPSANFELQGFDLSDTLGRTFVNLETRYDFKALR